MSRSQDRIIEQQAIEITRLREALAEVRGEVTGLRRGESTVTVQLAKDIRLGTLREEQHRTNAARSYMDLQTVLRSVAAHVLDVRGGCDATAAVEVLAGELTAAGVPLRNAFITLQVERAESTAQVSAADAADALLSAPVRGPRHS